MEKVTAALIDLAIENWARWHWNGLRRRPRRIKSLEGRWRSPQPWDTPPITPLGRVDVLAAQAVEDAWQTLSFVPKMVLKQWFVLRVSLRRICRSLRVKGYPVYERYWELEIGRAKLQLADALALQKKTADNPPVAEFIAPLAPLGGASAPAANRQAA